MWLEVSVDDNRGDNRFSPLRIKEEERLLGPFVLGLDDNAVRRVANERPVDDAVAGVFELVPMPADVEVGFFGLVPLGNGFVHWNRDTPDSPLILDGVAVVNPHGLSINIKESVVGLVDDEFHPLFLQEMKGEGVVHQVFQ